MSQSTGGRRPRTPPPEPPGGQVWQGALTATVAAGREFYHVSRAHHVSGRYFGTGPGARFNAPAGQYGVFYAGTTLECAVLEMISVTRQPQGPCEVVEAEIAGWKAWKIKINRPLKVCVLAGTGLRAIGADVRITGGDDYDLSQRWSFAIHQNASMWDAIYYTTRHGDDLTALAIFARADAAITVTEWGVLNDRAVPDLWIEMSRILRDNHIHLLPSWVRGAAPPGS